VSGLPRSEEEVFSFQLSVLGSGRLFQLRISMQQVDYYLRQFRQGDRDGAFYGLLEMSHDVLPSLMTIFRMEPDPGVRAFLVEVIWQHRELSSLSFLGDALCDCDPKVWRQALDGLVTLTCPAALDVLKSVQSRLFSSQRDTDEFRHWIIEAIEQVEMEIYRT
jgi:hypothetical protein